MQYREEQILQLHTDYIQMLNSYTKITVKYINISGKLKNNIAKEYILEGFLRRLNILKNCIDNIFSIYPPEKTTRLEDEELHNIMINFQAFIINIFGSIDNLAWVIAKEKDLKITEKIQISFKNNKIQQELSDSFKEYMATREDWFKAMKDFRDALAHRIPPYVPMGIDPETLETHNLPMITHSYIEKSKQFILHPQILCDWMTIVEFAEKFYDELSELLKT